MAPYSVAANERGVRRKAITPGDEDVVTFARDCDEVEVLLHADVLDELYFTVDGTTVEIAGNATHILPAQAGALTVAVPTPGSTVVKLKSESAVIYSVTGSG